MKSAIQLFYEEQMFEEGMPPFSELTEGEKLSISNSLVFARWNVSHAAQQVTSAFGVTMKQAAENLGRFLNKLNHSAK